MIFLLKFLMPLLLSQLTKISDGDTHHYNNNRSTNHDDAYP